MKSTLTQRVLWLILSCAPFLLNSQNPVSPVIASVKGGRFNAPFSVTLSTATANAVIRYTLDGNEPDSLTSPQYSAPLAISNTTTLRARAFAPNQVRSVITSHTYLFNVNHTFPIAALSFKPADFFDATKGIYPNYDDEIEVPVHFEFFEPNNNTAVIDQDLGVEIQGSASAALPQKSLQLKAKAVYGASSMKYAMFPSLPFTEYKRLVLRNGGQDWGITMFRDELVSSLVYDLSDIGSIIQKPELYVSAYRPSVVYYNGQYWGIHNVRERMKTPFVEQRFNLKGSEYDMVENENIKVNGDSTVWLNFQTYLNSGVNFSNTAAFEDLKNRIDLKNFLDYNVFNIIIDNQDWPANNNRRFIKKAAGSKWTWISYDFDFSMGLFQATGGWNTGDPTPNALRRLLDVQYSFFNNFPWSTLLFRKCMENASFRRDFINRTADMLNTVFKSERVNRRIDAFRSLYEPEINAHFQRWGTPNRTTWEENINKIRFFANNRTVNMHSHYAAMLPEVSGVASVNLQVSPANAGSIQWSTLNLSGSNLPFNGTYFKGVDIPVVAVAAPGYVFAGWSNTTWGNNASITVRLSNDINLTALFVPTGSANNPCLNDQTPPSVANCPNTINVSTATTCAAVNWNTLSVTDNCPGTIVVRQTAGLANGSCFPIGTSTVSYQATDAANNSTNCTFNVVVTSTNPCATDNTPPTISCPANITRSTSASCETVSWANPNATDNCTATPSVSQVSGLANGACFPIGTNSVTYRATDNANNQATCSFSIIINQTTPPPSSSGCANNVLKNSSFENGISNDYWTVGNVTISTDAVSGTKAAVLCNDEGGIGQIADALPNVTYTIRAFAKKTGNTEYANIYLEFFDENYAVLRGIEKPITTDTYVSYEISATAPARTRYVQTFFYKGSGGCVFADDFCITSARACDNDVTPPSITCPNNQVLTTSGNCATTNWTTPVSTDNCSTPSVTSSVASGTCFALGTTTVTLTATDAKGNRANCSFTVTVQAAPTTSVTNDLAVTVEAAPTYQLFTVHKFLIKVKNLGNNSMNNILIECPFPEGTATGGTATPSVGIWSEYCSGGIRCFRWSIPSLAAQAQGTLELPLFIKNISTPITFRANLSSSTPADGNATNNIGTFTVTKAASGQFLATAGRAPDQYIPVVITAISPNPTEGDIRLDAFSLDERDVTFYISDAIGKITQAEKRRLLKGYNRLTFDVYALPQGIYFIKPSTFGGKGMPTKFVKL